jgi:hypothetical protein
MRSLIIAAALMLFAAALPARAEDEVVGRIKVLTSPATVTSGSQVVQAEVGTPLHANDVVETGEGGAVGLSFKDDTLISLGPKSKLTIDEFVFTPAEEKYSFATKMARGTMYYVSGTMAKLAPDKVSVATPVGTIGIRGTRFLVKLDD